MRANVKSGQMYVFRGRVVKKRGRLMMEQPEVFTREAYDALEHSMQPVYGQTRGLSNKTIVKAQKQALEMRPAGTGIYAGRSPQKIRAGRD